MNITPGPWNVEDPYIVAPNTGIVAKVWEPDSGYGYASDNARLIAAAPALLEALNQIAINTSRRMAEGGDKQDYQDANRQAGDIARAAIRRVTQE